ncbi:MAG: YaiO family outer membrane beta-barrel protein [Bacteroidia bacterium]|nr:YaiO family outer membrane beta-barrel protein [Bacteroidia bacterium]
MQVIKVLGKVVGVFFIFLFSFSQLTVDAQTAVSVDTTSLESLLVKAREFAYNNGKAQARKICRQIISRDSTYWDAAVLMGRTYAWDQKYDSARIVLNKVIEQRAGYYDAVDALIDAELLSENYLRAIKYADIGLSFHPNDGSFLYKKARALNNSGNSQKASTLLSQIPATDPSNKDAAVLLLSIRRDKMVNKLTLNYWTYLFKDDSPWSFASAAIGRKTSKFGTVTLRYNYAQRFGNDGHQIELDAYPAIVKGIYLYFNTGISNKKNFPYSRLTIEPYFKLPASFEMSIGFRYMNFDDKRIAVVDSNMVMIYTGTIGKYYGNYWFSLRPYLTPGKEGWSGSANLTIRRYLADADSYLSLIVGTGISPDIQQYAFNPGYYLKSNKIALEYQQKIAYRFFLNLGTGFAREEIRAGTKRDRYSLDLGVSFLF